MARSYENSNFQAIHRFAVHQVRFDDFVDVRFINIGIPGAFRIDHAYRPLFATVQAAGLVDAHPALTGDAQFFDLFLGIFPNPVSTTLVAVRAI